MATSIVSLAIPSKPDQHRAALINRYGRKPRKVRRPRELRFGTRVTDANGATLRRYEEGWRHITRRGTPHGEPIGTLDLAYPLTINA